MMHLEGRDAVVRHLRAKFQGNRKDPPDGGDWPESHPAAPHGPEPGQTPPVGSKGKLPPEPPQIRRVDYSRASPSHSTGQSVGQHSPPHPTQETLARMARRKQVMAQGTNFHLAKPGEGGVLNKEVGAGSDAPQRKPAWQTRPLTKDKGVPVVPAKGAAVAAPLVTVGSSHSTGPPALPQRKPLPHISMLGVKPAKPWHPPVMDLAKFKAAAHPGTPIRPATKPPRNTQLGHLRPGCAGAGPARLPLQDAPSGTGDEDGIYDDAESVGLPRRSPGLLLPPVSRPPVYPCPRAGGDAGQASNRVTLLAAAQSECREAQVSQKMKTMTLKECKKEEKADKEFQKKFKFEGSIKVLSQMMVDPAATEKRGRGKNLPVQRGEILDVIQFTNEEQILCRNSQRRYGYVPRAVMLHLDTDIYDDVETYG